MVGRKDKTHIALEVGIGRTTLERFLIQNNLECKVSGYFWKDHLQELQDYLDKGHDFKEAADYFGVSVDSVSIIVNRKDLTYNRPVQKVLTEDEIKVVKEMFEEGKQYTEMSEVLPSKKRPGLISRFIRLYGVSYGFDTTNRSIDPMPVTRSTTKKRVRPEKIDYTSLGVSNQNKFKALKLFLGRDPVWPELRTRYRDIFTKDYIIESLESGEWELPKTSSLINMSISEIHKLCVHFGISLEEGKEKYLTKQINQLYLIDDMSLPEIMEYLEISESAVRNKIKKNYKESDKLRSQGELMTISALNSLGIEFTEQKLYTDVAREYRNFVKIDFEFIHNGIKYWIEYNGYQHYDEKGFIGLSNNTADRDDFLVQLNRDRCVRNYARNNGIVLIEIPYTVTSISRINKIISDFLESGNTNNIDLSELYTQIRSYGINPID